MRVGKWARETVRWGVEATIRVMRGWYFCTCAAEICPRLPVVAVVLLDDFEGRPFALSATELVEVEAGRQGTASAADNATRVARAFLGATGVLPAQTTPRPLPVYRLGRPIEKPPAKTYEVFAENFERVEAGQAFAAADGEPLVAEEAFYPVLLSADGYADQFGYEGQFVRTLPASAAGGASP